MAGSVRAYADTVAGTLGTPADPAIAELLAGADALDAALAAPATLDAALARWRAATHALRDRLLDYLLAEIPVGNLPLLAPGDDWDAPDGVRLEASLGPLGLVIASPPLRLADPRDATGPGIVIGQLLPSSLAAHLDAGPVSGDGSVSVLADGVSGALALHLGTIEVAALASLRRAAGGASFAAVFSAGFTPGIQFGFGFQLSRVGGVVGINRAVDEHAIATRLRDGSAGEVLFPLDIGASALRALAALEAILPPRAGNSVVGPTLRLSWLEIGGQGFLLARRRRADRASRAAAGRDRRYRAGRYPPVLKLRVDVLGVLDFAQQTVSVDASLVDSGLLDIFTIYGDLAFRQCWGPQAYTVLSAGGFYPGFRPEPASIPPLRRLGFHLDSPVPGIDVRAEGYLAVTSNTVQLGGYLEAGISAGGCGAHGFISVDALVQFAPFHAHADVSAGFEVEVFGLTFCGIRLDGTVDGPGPVTIHGRLTVETFLHDFHFDETFSFGSGNGPPAVPPARAAQVLADQEVRPAPSGPSGARTSTSSGPGSPCSPDSP